MVWVPKYGARAGDVSAAAQTLSDRRQSHYWDEGGGLMAKYRPVLALAEDAWDIYMLYGPSARWDGDNPPRPDYWMHQLGTPNRPRVKAPFLDAATLAARAKALLTVRR